MILKVCSLCDGDLVPHCDISSEGFAYSSTCDLVVCVDCGQTGTLEGRYFDVKQAGRKGWAALARTVNELRDDSGDDLP